MHLRHITLLSIIFTISLPAQGMVNRLRQTMQRVAAPVSTSYANVRAAVAQSSVAARIQQINKARVQPIVKTVGDSYLQKRVGLSGYFAYRKKLNKVNRALTFFDNFGGSVYDLFNYEDPDKEAGREWLKQAYAKACQDEGYKKQLQDYLLYPSIPSTIIIKEDARFGNLFLDAFIYRKDKVLSGLFAYSDYSTQSLDIALKQFPEKTSLCVERALEICKTKLSSLSWGTIEVLMKAAPESVSKFTDLYLAQLEANIRFDSAWHIFMLRKIPNATEAVLSVLSRRKYVGLDRELLWALGSYSHHGKRALQIEIDKMLQAESISPTDAKALQSFFECGLDRKIRVRELASKLIEHKKEHYAFYFKELFEWHYDIPEVVAVLSPVVRMVHAKTPEERNESDEYVVRHQKGVFHSLSKYYNEKNPELLAMRAQSEEVRRKRTQAGYSSFIHGQYWPYQLSVKLNMDLWALCNEQDKPSDYVMPHVRQTGDMSEEENMRKSILEHGRKSQADRDRMLFLNHPFEGNAGNWGSCTASYIADNISIHKDHIDMSGVFKAHGLNELYKKHEEEIKQLQSKHAALAKRGNLLSVSVKNEWLPELVMEVRGGGGKVTNVTAEHLAQFRKNPRDTEFVMVVTDDLANNPESAKKGILKIEMINEPGVSKDPRVQQQAQEFETAYQALLSKIAPAVKARNEARAREQYALLQ